MRESEERTMRRADRLFDIIQRLRGAGGPLTADLLAAELEVTSRTIYRDIATLQARRVPIEGAAGVGYVLRRGFDLPPLMFTPDEIEAIALGIRLLRRTGDDSLQTVAASVLAKVTEVLPEALRASLADPAIFVAAPPRSLPKVDLTAIRGAIRGERKLRITYIDEQGRRTRRTIWPFVLAYGYEAVLIAAWCELREDFRHFRADRILRLKTEGESYPEAGRALMARWLATLQNEGSAPAATPTSPASR